MSLARVGAHPRCRTGLDCSSLWWQRGHDQNDQHRRLDARYTGCCVSPRTVARWTAYGDDDGRQCASGALTYVDISGFTRLTDAWRRGTVGPRREERQILVSLRRPCEPRLRDDGATGHVGRRRTAAASSRATTMRARVHGRLTDAGEVARHRAVADDAGKSRCGCRSACAQRLRIFWWAIGHPRELMISGRARASRGAGGSGETDQIGRRRGDGRVCWSPGLLGDVAGRSHLRSPPCWTPFQRGEPIRGGRSGVTAMFAPPEGDEHAHRWPCRVLRHRWQSRRRAEAWPRPWDGDSAQRAAGLWANGTSPSSRPTQPPAGRSC
jgi:hypothetical protein